MPRPEQILAGLTEIANKWSIVAILWHAYFGALALALAVGARPLRRTVGVLLGLPLLCVSALAWTSGNPFNGALFAILGSVSIAIAAKLPDSRVQVVSTRTATIGAVLFVFGWVYPHFLGTSSFVVYLYSAPIGLLPCPTLSAVTGLGLAVGGLGSRSWSIFIGAASGFYGIFGTIWLGVTIDCVLLAGGVTIVSYVLINHKAGDVRAA